MGTAKFTGTIEHRARTVVSFEETTGGREIVVSFGGTHARYSITEAIALARAIERAVDGKAQTDQELMAESAS